MRLIPSQLKTHFAHTHKLESPYPSLFISVFFKTPLVNLLCFNHTHARVLRE